VIEKGAAPPEEAGEKRQNDEEHAEADHDVVGLEG